MNKFTELVKKIREIFQIDRADLDFGIYRILNARSEEISQFLDKELQKQVKKALVSDNSEKLRQKKEELKAKEEDYRQDGVDPDSVPKIKELRQEIAGYMSENVDYENEVYSHLLRFFSRYYDKGDFISRRRYKADTYAVPYSGEEVVLHWANKDQYYIKSGEYFSNYSFNLDDGRRVTFKLVSADTAKDNRKDTDQNRLFALVEPHVRVRQDEDGDEYEEKIETIIEGNDELVINFVYAPQPKGTKQTNLVKEALEVLLNKPEISKNWQELLERRPIESNPARTLLEKQLTDYTEKNNADYFIHKDLGGFLRRELDFYIKSEVMNLDDIQYISTFKGIEKNLKMIQCLRLIAGHLIDFMAQLENFQKKLWLKKKFVVETNYCITLDRIPEEFYDEICKNEAQLEEWVKLFAIDEIKKDLNQTGFSRPLKKAFLKGNDKLVLDTKFFSKMFKYRLLSSIDNLEEQCDGLLIHSENFQALSLLRESYLGQIQCVYIDPPYNAQSSEILYKNSYKHSSWLSLMHDRVNASKPILTSDFVYVTAIDEVENAKLGLMFEDTFPSCEDATISIVHNPTGQQGNNFSFTHEFAHFVYPKNQVLIGLEDREEDLRESKPDVRPLRNVSSGRNHLRESAANCFYPIFVKDGSIIGFGDVCSDDFHPGSINIKRDDGTIEVYPIDPSGIESKWVFAKDTVESIFSELTAEYNSTKKQWDIIRKKTKFRYKSLWSDKRYSANSWGSVILNKILPNNPFNYPKSLFTVKDCVDAGMSNRDHGIILDFFAGSGTTGHAVVDLNREDNGNRKFILVEMGEYFNAVTKPRVTKIIYSSGWEAGKPASRNTGVSNFFKYIVLESYEDTLNNLVLSRAKPQQAALDDATEKVKNDYLLKYMLDVESRDSLLNTDLFKKPFDYTLDIATDSAGASKSRQVDLIETFNYLIGLKVQKLNVNPDQGQAIVEGITTAGEKVLVIWRDCEKVDYNDLNKLCERLRINPRDFEYDVLYVNGDHNIPQTITLEAADGGITRTMKLRQTEDEFFRRMFACEEI